MDQLKNVYRQTFKTIKNHPKLIILASLLVALIGNLLLQVNSYYGIDYHSDDVSQQVLTQVWLSHGFHGTWFGPDPFLVKVPIHAIVEIFFGQSRNSIFVSAFLLSGGMITLIFFSARLIAKKISQNPRNIFWFLLVFPYAGSIFSYPMMASFKNANLRTIELGVWFVLLLVIFLYLNTKELKISKKFGALAVTASALFGFLIFNDRAMLFFCGLPTLLFLAYMYFINDTKRQENRKLLFVGGLILLSIVFYKLWEILFTALGLTFYDSTMQFITYDKLWYFLNNSIYNVLAMFNADIFGQPIGTLQTFVKLMNGTVLVIGLIGMLYFLIKGDSWRRFFAAQPIIIFTSYVLSGFATDASTARYLILVPFYIVLIIYLLVETILQRRNKRLAYLIVGIITVTTLLNIGSYAYWTNKAIRTDTPKESTRNYSQMLISDIAKKKGITKGYAPHSQANLINYFSHYTTNASPLYCPKDNIKPFYILMSEKPLHQHAERSFVVAQESSPATIVPDEYPALSLPSKMDYSCPTKTVIEKFGEPEETVSITKDIFMLIYDFDVLQKIDLSRTDAKSPIK